ncbi:hypothetical protein [Methylocaldum sp.]|uniref:hypothetical protein n=1 Tax=Methylocaldum sp. TaxID=1969727 RepID=UPI002D26228A|nr:hypothetical protein [Methylocaldum sp.]HYE34303.1 hypothetical protein [Methylocaldum sp.]
MENNILLTSEFNGDINPGIKTFTLQPHRGVVGKKLGSVLPVYKLVPANTLSSIIAYWCPYRANELHSVTVGRMARFMFTATMDGCSLGVGTDGGHGTRVISHVNSANYGSGLEQALGMDKARAEQRKMQSNLLKHKHGSGQVSVISPLEYMRDVDGDLVLKSTTFGIRPDGIDDWHFYVHRYYKDMSKFNPILYLRDTTRVF